MKVSREWLQHYFEKPLPKIEELADALTFHAFEIESAQGDLLDVKILPNRAADCLSHNGIAGELAAIFDLPRKYQPLRDALPAFPETDQIKVEIEYPKKCPRYMAALVKGVKVGPSPLWLREAMESVGQKSINNVVDAMNFVMLDIGQPLHAFDAAKVARADDAYGIKVREAKAGEKIIALTGEEYALPGGVLVIADASDTALGIAGIKGGKESGVSETTTDIIIEAASFDGATIRKAAQSLKLFTDSSLRFQNNPSPDLAAYGIAGALRALEKAGGGEVVGVVDVYSQKQETTSVSVSLEKGNSVLGSHFSREQVRDVFRRLALDTVGNNDMFTITSPFERTDLIVAEDLIEEVGRIIGYDKIAAVELPALNAPPDQARYRGIERMKDQLVEQGFTEVSTQSFAKKGDVYLANPLDKDMPALRTTLVDNLKDALAKAKHYAPLVLNPGEKPKLFEVGTVFPNPPAGGGEYLALDMTETAWEGVPTHDNLTIAKLEDYGKDYAPKRYELGAYKPFSIYPFIARDIAAWVPNGTAEREMNAIINPILKKFSIGGMAIETIIRILGDPYVKEGRTSLAVRIIFNPFGKTLTDEEVNVVMEKISAALAESGYEVR